MTIVGVEVMVSLYAVPFPVLSLTLHSFQFWNLLTIAETQVIARTVVGTVTERKKGRRFVLIWLNLEGWIGFREVEKKGIQRHFLKTVGGPESLCSEEIGK